MHPTTRRCAVALAGLALLAGAFLAGRAAAQDDAPPPRQTYVYFINPARGPAMVEAPTPEESQAVAAHFQHLLAKFQKGELILAGPSLEPPHTGIVVFEAQDAQAAREFLEADPAVAAGVFTGRLSPISVALLRGRDEARLGG